MAEEMTIESLDVLEPKMWVNDEMKVIYINEAMEEKLQDKTSAESEAYEAAKAAHEGYVTWLRRMPMKVEYMKRFAEIKHDTYLIDLIARKEEILRNDNHQYEMSLFDAFKNMFFARYPQCRNVFKMLRWMNEHDAK